MVAVAVSLTVSKVAASDFIDSLDSVFSVRLSRDLFKLEIVPPGSSRDSSSSDPPSVDPSDSDSSLSEGESDDSASGG